MNPNRFASHEVERTPPTYALNPVVVEKRRVFDDAQKRGVEIKVRTTYSRTPRLSKGVPEHPSDATWVYDVIDARVIAGPTKLIGRRVKGARLE